MEPRDHSGRAAAVDLTDPRLLEVLDAIPAPIMAFDRAGVLLAANSAFAQLVGATDADFADPEYLRHLIHPDDLESTLAAWRNWHQRGDERLDGTARAVRPDGSMPLLHYSVSRLLGADGEVRGSLGVWIDVTPMHEAQESARAEREYFEALSERSSDVVTVLDANGEWRSSSESAGRLLGHPRGYDPPGGLFSLLHPDDLEAAGRALDEVFTGANLVADPLEVRLRRADGEYLNFEVVAKNLIDDPIVNGIVINGRDVTERRRAERALSRRDAEYFQLLELMDEGVLALERDGTTVYANPRMGEVLGTGANALIGRDARAFLPSSMWPVVEQVLASNDLAASVRRELAFASGDAELHTLVVASPRVGDDGNVAGAVIVVTDITAQKVAQSAAEEAREEAERRSTAKTEMLARISHDLRTPIHVIKGAIELFDLDAEPGAATAVDDGALDLIATAADRLSRLVDDLVDVARLEARALALRDESVDIDTAVDAAVMLVQPALASRVDVSGTPGLWVRGDESRIVQVLGNLLGNALRHGPADTTVRIHRAMVDTPEGPQVVIAVSDEGSGVMAGDEERIFEPFVSRSGGSGLGLAIASGLASAMGGSVRLLLPSEAVRTTFELALVATAPEVDDWFDDDLDEGGATDGAAAASVEPAGRIDVLCVEDDTTNIELLRAIFSLRDDLTLVAATTVAEGMSLLAEQRFDVVLMDVNLPDGSGLDALAKLRAEPATSELPVIVVTADATGTTAAIADSLCAPLLTKPVVITELLGAIDDAARRARPAQEATC